MSNTLKPGAHRRFDERRHAIDVRPNDMSVMSNEFFPERHAPGRRPSLRWSDMLLLDESPNHASRLNPKFGILITSSRA